MVEYETCTALWDEVYQECQLVDLTGEILKVEPTFDACLELFAKHSPNILDFGCGTGDILFQCADFGYLSYGLGVDRSEVGITFAKQMANLNHYRKLDFVLDDESYLSQLDDELFDGIILSNVLDVIPKETADQIMLQLKRILKNGGLLFIKINPYISNEELGFYEFTHLRDNLFVKDGFLRLRRMTTHKWQKEFERDFIIERYLEFPYPWQEGMNRLFLLQKK